ncbi:unnamed protein product, partial [Rotaria sordida]
MKDANTNNLDVPREQTRLSSTIAVRMSETYGDHR